MDEPDGNFLFEEVSKQTQKKKMLYEKGKAAIENGFYVPAPHRKNVQKRGNQTAISNDMPAPQMAFRQVCSWFKRVEVAARSLRPSIYIRE